MTRRSWFAKQAGLLSWITILKHAENYHRIYRHCPVHIVNTVRLARWATMQKIVASSSTEKPVQSIIKMPASPGAEGQKEHRQNISQASWQHTIVNQRRNGPFNDYFTMPWQRLQKRDGAFTPSSSTISAMQAWGMVNDLAGRLSSH